MHKSDDSFCADEEEHGSPPSQQHDVSQRTSGSEFVDGDQIMTINEEVQTIEFAPALFEAIRKMDGVTDRMIQRSLKPELNRR
jgi:hypothetical protein